MQGWLVLKRQYNTNRHVECCEIKSYPDLVIQTEASGLKFDNDGFLLTCLTTV